ncbi:MAG: helix-turn-helix domain-containing protein [Candidatus Binatia bacterium]
MSQSKLAEVLETTGTSVARWERGERRISGPVSVCMRLLEKYHPREAKK